MTRRLRPGRGRLLLAACLAPAAASQAPPPHGVAIKVTSPHASRTYLTNGLRPGVELEIHDVDHPLALGIRARLADYELCVNFDFGGSYGMPLCKGLASSDDLPSIVISTLPHGQKVFRASLRPAPGGGAGLLSEEELSVTAVEVVYRTGSLAPSPSGTSAPLDWVLALHYSHDAHVAVLHGGVPVLVLELERLVEKRYFSGIFLDEGERAFAADAWRQAAAAVAKATGVDRFDAGVFNSIFTGFGGAWEGTFLESLRMACDAFNVDQ